MNEKHSLMKRTGGEMDSQDMQYVYEFYMFADVSHGGSRHHYNSAPYCV